MEVHKEILRLAIEGNLPKEIDESSDVSVDVVRELIEAGLLSAIDASSFDGTAYLEPRITMAGREYVQSHHASEPENQVQHASQSESMINLFISHTSQDLELVRALVDLLRTALALPPSEIRCTSLDGYRLPGGADTDDTLRREVRESRAFVGLISNNALQSLYVVFELGARWGVKEHLVPLLAPGVDPSSLGGPLAGKNALRADSPAQLHQLVSELARYLNVELQPASTYQRYIDQIVAMPGNPSREGTAAPQDEGQIGDTVLDDLEIEIVKSLSGLRDSLRSDQIAHQLQVHPDRASYYLDELDEKGFLSTSLIMNDGMYYSLGHNGRKFLVENDLLDD